MPLLPDVSASSLNADDPQKQIQAVVRQINEAFRLLSNEGKTTVYKDNSGINRIIIGVLPDGETGIVISKSTIDVLTAFS